MTKREVEKYLKDKQLFKNPRAKRIGKGHNSDIFLIKDRNKIYTLRVRRNSVIAEDILYKQYITLKFLQNENIKFVPRPEYFDKKNNILIATYVPGKDIIKRGLRGKYFDLFIKQLIKIHSLNFVKYKKFCKENGFKLVLPEAPMENIREFGIKRFNFINKHCSDRNIIKWIKPRFKENINYIKKIKLAETKLIFSHSDLTGDNILIHKNRIYFIDWEWARFVYTLDYRLSYMIIHFDFFREKQNKLISLYAKYARINKNKLKNDVHNGMKITKVNDIIWSAKAYIELINKNLRGWKKFYKMTYIRMREYEKKFEK